MYPVMTDLVLVDRLGDINFGLPEDLAPHRTPWAYYHILGVPQDASPQEIKKAVRALTRKNHPDYVATHSTKAQEEAGKRQKLVNDISDVLLDDGGALGSEYSKRGLYDQVCRYGEFFGAVHIGYHGKRTVTVVEDLLDVLELEKRGVEAKSRFETEHPEIAGEMRKFERAMKQGDRYSARESSRKIVEALAAKEGMTPAEFEQKQREEMAEFEKRKRERDQKNYRFAEGLLSELRTEKAKSGETADKESPKVFDIWYNGKKDGFSTVTFGTSGYPHCSVVGYDESEGVVRMGLKDNAELTGMRKVHFKAQYAVVTIRDAHLEGIFQIAEGNVTVEHEGSSYGTVLRVRAPHVHVSSDFVQQGDLYVPRSFVVEGWEKREPKVDIAVFKGSVNVRMKQKEVQRARGSYTGFGDYSLEDKIISSFNKSLIEIITLDSLNNNNYKKGY